MTETTLTVASRGQTIGKGWVCERQTTLTINLSVGERCDGECANSDTKHSCIDSAGKMPELPMLDMEAVTRVILKGRNENPQVLASVLPPVLECRHLVHLEIAHCSISQYATNLQFSEMWLLEKLSVTHTDMSQLHPSIGSLKELKDLDLSHNQLSSLPHTLQYCYNLQILDLCHNSFTSLPGVILKLTKLHTLKRLHNRLMIGISQYQTSTNFQQSNANSGPVDGKFNPNSLQLFCVKQLTGMGIHAWRSHSIAYRLRGVMAHQQSFLQVCDHCGIAEVDSDHSFWVTTVMYQFAGNTYIPFGHYACSQPCAENIYNRVELLSKKSEIEMDQQYKADSAESNSSDQYSSRNYKRNKHKLRSQRRICSIM